MLWFWDTGSVCTHAIDTRCFLVLCILGFFQAILYLTMYSMFVILVVYCLVSSLVSFVIPDFSCNWLVNSVTEQDDCDEGQHKQGRKLINDGSKEMSRFRLALN